MCGIAGIFGASDAALVQAMTGTFYHRGPDDEFHVSGKNFNLGARRLAIVGVNSGRQPLSDESGMVWASQNGELYNFPKARHRLVEQGHTLRTTCDTEILPHLYEQYGADFPKHIDGMFAAAVWDDRTHTGVVARDRMGKKPLYYLHQNGVLYFASEIKALLCLPGFKRHLNPEALHHYLSLKHVPCPLSIFEGIYQLPPGHRLVYRPGQPLDVAPYWTLSYTPRPETASMSMEEARDTLLKLLRKSVERRLMSDVPIGFLLSGGVDSSLTTVLAAELADSRIKTFTLTYGEDSTTGGKEADRHWAKWVAEKYQTEHYEENIRFSHFPDAIKQVLHHFDEPFAGVISTYFLSQLISQHVKVALAGDGADELFGSYRSHRLAFPMANYAQQPDETLADLYEPEDFAWRYKLLVMSDADKNSLYSPAYREHMAKYSTFELMRGYFSHLTARDPLNRMLEAEFRSFLPDQVMTFVDRLSMAHSLELRAPYLDTELVEFVTQLPGHFKIHQGETKYLLKQAALTYFPREMLFRPKEGFLMPVANWLLNDLEDYVRQTLSPAQLQKHGIFDVAQVQHMVDYLYREKPDYTYINRVMALLIFQEWYDAYQPALA